MPKKKERKKNLKGSTVGGDFTIDDSANAPKPVRKLKKSVECAPPPELSWEQLQDEEYDLVEEINEDGTKTIIHRKKRNHSRSEDSIDDQPGIVHPEIVWYLISKFIKPEDVGRFACINKSTYAMTKRETFWRLLYKKYCVNNPNLPEKLRLENSYKAYGLRQRVIRGLYHTYDVFIKRVVEEAAHDSTPHQLVKRRCVNVWYSKGLQHWFIYFKFKKASLLERFKESAGLIEELGRVDANPEENSQVLQITCQNFYEVPPLMGMTLSSVSVVLSQGFRHHRLHLGFNTGSHNVSRDILPECTVILDSVVNIVVYDWWHPKYPFFDNKLPLNMRDEEALPVLKNDFFN